MYSTPDSEWVGENVHSRLFLFYAHNHDKTLYILVSDYTHVYFNTERSLLKNYSLQAANKIPRVRNETPTIVQVRLSTVAFRFS